MTDRKKRSSSKGAAKGPEPATAGKPSARLEALALAIVVITTLVVYWPVQTFHFVNYDDPAFITNNPRMQEGLSLRNLGWAFTVSIAANWHPLTTISHLIDCSLWGPDAGGHHVTGLVIHLAAVMALYLLLRRLSLSFGVRLLVTGLFALHPLNVESVAWVSERKNVLSQLFLFLTLWAYAAYARTRSRRDYALALALFVAGLLSKSMLVSVPLLLVLLDFWPLRRSSLADPKAALRDAVRLLPEKLPFVALSLASCVVTILTQRATAVGALQSFPIAARLMNAAVSYVAYVADMVLPTHLSPFYPYLGMDTGAWRSIGAAVLLVGATAVAWQQRVRRPYVLVGWLWYVVTLVPVIGLVQVGAQARADRYAYLPLIGLFLVVALLAEELVQRTKVKRATWYAAGGAVLLCLSVMSRAQAMAWYDNQSLFQHALQALPDAYVDHNKRGLWLVKERRFDEAAEQFEAAVAIKPDFGEAWSNLGQVRIEQRNPEEAVRCYEEALRYTPGNPKDLNNLGIALAGLRRFEEAEKRFAEALKLDPAYPSALFNYAGMMQEQGRTSEAVAEFRRGGALLASKGKLSEALGSYEAALRLAPDDAQARSGAEEVRQKLGTTSAKP
jgi:tetratricopeptide (TPR) repeat protein